MRRTSIAVIFLTLALSSVSFPFSKKVVGYYPSWSKSSYPHTAIQFRNLTHISHAFIFPFADGSLDYSSFTFYPELITAAHANGVKVVMAVGGWDAARTPRFGQMAADTTARKKFVSQIVQLIQMNSYDGIDLDWEYPKTAAERTNLKTLVHELRVALDATGKPLSLSMAGPATWWSGQWFDFESMKNDFDWIGIMTYDFYGAWTSKAGPNSALYGNFNKNTEGWIDYSFTYYNATRGVPKEKLLIGIPFYGQVFNASAMYTTSSGATQSTYANIAPKLSQGWTRHWDAEGQVPFLVNAAATQVISYDDSQSVAQKCAYVNGKGGGGAIIWAIGQDQFQGKTPLLSTVGTLLLAPSSAGPGEEPEIPALFSLRQNFPNPFNGESSIRYRVGIPGEMNIELFNILGQRVQRIAEGFHNAGEYEVRVSSESLASGVYLYRLTAHTFTTAKTMVIIR